MTTLQTDWQPLPNDLIDKAVQDVTRQLEERPDYHALFTQVRAAGHRLEYRVIRGAVTEEAVNLILQVRDGGPKS